MNSSPHDQGFSGLRYQLKLWVTRGQSLKLLERSLYYSSAQLTRKALADYPFLAHVGGSAWLRLQWKTLLRRKTPQLGAVLVNGFGRFGNSIIQLLNVEALAAQLSATRVFYHRFDLIDNTDLSLSDDTQLVRTSPLTRKGPVPDAIWATHGIRGTELLVDPCGPQAARLRRRIAEIVLPEGPPLEVSDKELTIHIRSGDIFGVKPHPHYGQPPLAFYQQVIRSQNWQSVTILAEDELNPSVRALHAWCDDIGLPSYLQIAGLTETIRTVARSTAVVAGRGTFIPAIVSLYPKPRNLFFFELGTPPMLLCDRRNTIHVGEDATGEYRSTVLSGNWSASKTQQALMLSYPVSSLAPLRKTEVPSQ